MPLVNVNGPKWSRPVVRSAEQRLSGLNPVRRFIAAFFRRSEPPRENLTAERDGPESDAG